MLNIIDEFTHECLAIRIDRKLKSDRRHRCAVRPVHPARRSRAHSLGQWTGVRRQGRARLDRAPSEPRPLISRRAAPGRTASSRASTPGSGTSCSMARSSTRSRRPGSSSRAGGVTTTPRGRTDHWATSRRARGLHARHRRAGGCATPTSSAARASTEPVLELTFQMDPSVGADREASQIVGPLYEALNEPGKKDAGALLAKAAHPDYRSYHSDENRFRGTNWPECSRASAPQCQISAGRSRISCYW